MSEKKTLLLQPIQGKFVQSTINGKITRVWLVDPDTNQKGTEIDYEDAINMLALPHPVVCLAQVKGKDGKYIKQFTKEDEQYLDKRKEEFSHGISAIKSSSSESNFALEKLVETQSELIKSQNNQIASLQSQFNALPKQMEKVLKKADK